MLCPIKVNSNTIELTMRKTSCYCISDLLCVLNSIAVVGKVNLIQVNSFMFGNVLQDSLASDQGVAFSIGQF